MQHQLEELKNFELKGTQLLHYGQQNFYALLVPVEVLEITDMQRKA